MADKVLDALTLRDTKSGTATEYKIQDSVLKARVDALTKLGEGSTTGDAELQDIRVDYKGTTHENAGDAVRASNQALNDKIDDEVSKLKEDIANLQTDVYTVKTIEAYETARGLLRRDGTIETSYGGTIYKYKVPDGARKVYFNGYSTFEVSGWANLWLVDSNSQMISFVAQEENPTTYENYEIAIPENCKEIWACCRERDLYFCAGLKNRVQNIENDCHDIKESLTLFNEIESYENIVGVLKKDGTINTSFGGTIYKYHVSNCEYVYISGKTSMSVGAGWASIWIVDLDGNMIEYYEPSTEPQQYDRLKVKIQNGCTEIWTCIKTPKVEYTCYLDSEKFISEIRSELNHWNGKTWYAYGTSITSSSQGKYVPYVARFGGMDFVNKGIPGGGLTGDGLVKSALMNTTDGKLTADLITLEVGANEGTVNLGTKYDTDDSTFCGCLNQCLRYLQENTNAQIVVMYSVATTQEPSSNSLYWEREEKVREVCNINNVYYIGDQSGLGYARIKNGSQYVTDHIHQTELGGYNLAQFVWSKLKNIPLWYSEIPV